MVAKKKKKKCEQLIHFQIKYWKIQNTTVINLDSIKKQLTNMAKSWRVWDNKLKRAAVLIFHSKQWANWHCLKPKHLTETHQKKNNFNLLFLTNSFLTFYKKEIMYFVIKKFIWSPPIPLIFFSQWKLKLLLLFLKWDHVTKVHPSIQSTILITYILDEWWPLEWCSVAAQMLLSVYMCIYFLHIYQVWNDGWNDVAVVLMVISRGLDMKWLFQHFPLHFSILLKIFKASNLFTKNIFL